MRIGFIGAGKVGTAFGIYLNKKGFDINGYYSRILDSAEKAARMTNSRAYDNMKSLVSDCEIIFITTQDDNILKVCNEIVESNINIEEKTFTHMSGVLTASVLEPLKEKGARIHSIHPLLAFADIEKAVKDLESTCFSIEGKREENEVLINILDKTDNKYFFINPEQKTIYHAAACVVSNYLTVLMDYGINMYKSIGVKDDIILEAIKPLVQGALDNVFNFGTEKALTGPIARGDVETVQSHVEAINKNLPEDLLLYKLLGEKTINLAKRKRGDIPNDIELIKLLEVDDKCKR